MSSTTPACSGPAILLSQPRADQHRGDKVGRNRDARRSAARRRGPAGGRPSRQPRTRHGRRQALSRLPAGWFVTAGRPVLAIAPTGPDQPAAPDPAHHQPADPRQQGAAARTPRPTTRTPRATAVFQVTSLDAVPRMTSRPPRSSGTSTARSSGWSPVPARTAPARTTRQPGRPRGTAVDRAGPTGERNTSPYAPVQPARRRWLALLLRHSSTEGRRVVSEATGSQREAASVLIRPARTPHHRRRRPARAAASGDDRQHRRGSGVPIMRGAVCPG